MPDWDLIPGIVQHATNRSLPAAVIPSYQEDPQGLMECLMSFYHIKKSVNEPPYHRYTLLDILDRSHPFKATDARDKIYSVLGLAEDANHLEIMVDYSCTAEQLYAGTAAKIVKHHPRGLELLYSCLHVKSLSLPSWVPDWSHREPGSQGATAGIGYSASGSTVSEVEVGGTHLHVAGCLIDKIEYVGAPIGPQLSLLGQDSAEYRAWLGKEYTDLMSPLDWKEDVATEVFWRTLIGNITGHETPADHGYGVFFEAMAFQNGQESSSGSAAMAGVLRRHETKVRPQTAG